MYKSSVNSILQNAYELGVKTAAERAGLIKTGQDEAGSAIWPALFGPLGGALAAPEGKGWRAAGGTALGTGLGTIGGGLGGAGLGALAALLTKGKLRPGQAALLPMAGAGLGATGGGMYGAAKGYREAIED